MAPNPTTTEIAARQITITRVLNAPRNQTLDKLAAYVEAKR